MTRRSLPLALFVLVAVAGCDVNPFDQAQVPIVSVTVEDGAPVISWTPAGASLVRVYEGSDTDGASLWEVQLGQGVPENGLRSPIVYGVVPPEGEEPFAAPPLVTGESYTAWVHRDDPEGSGDGFTNTHNLYTGEVTFVP